MPDELRHSQQHATMSSLKATHVAHRIALEIHSTPTTELAHIKIPTTLESPPENRPGLFKEVFLEEDRGAEECFNRAVHWAILILAFIACFMLGLFATSVF